MGMKIFAFPVRGRQWCFTALVPDVPTGKYSSVATFSQLWERLQSLPQFTDRAELIESFASAKMHKNWSELGAQPIGSIRHRMYRVGQNLLNRLPAEEQFLKTVPIDSPKVELVFPSRAHAHWRALQSSTRLKMLLTEGETEESTAEINKAPKTSSQNLSWVFTSSNELELLVKPDHVKAGVIQPSTISAISKTFGLNSEEVLRWISSK